MLEKKVKLSAWTTIGVGGEALFFASPSSEKEVCQCLRWAAQKGVPVFPLGGGSNVIFSDEGFAGLVIYLGRMRKFRLVGEEVIEAECGVPTAWAVRQVARLGLSGWECLSGIPGTLGGALKMNAGGKYGEIQERLLWVDWMDETGEVYRSRREEIHFAYRFSSIPGVILRAGFRLEKKEKTLVEAKTRAILLEKKASQPFGKKSAGCVFKNPVGDSAGRLIDQAGLKGMGVGRAVVSKKHANFVLNLGGARADDIFKLVELVRQRVWQRFGVWLETEVKMVKAA